ncbi:PBSX family phage terminase large subunit [Clostridium botulinum]|uniref:PBSX family phage terminase large subunit n=3 Tax=Clostridium botulinum TaxID=1491 RepID=A0A6G4HPT2_CLOBO|nr:PBSX family phage terminase large subunit [Clostridium botulinum]NFQ62469.1 PBSX family phage terminase large subunit [Clostridium botulinum]NFR17691.1 PBSX family phage terminase large subunit [Clostridium botulinum]NFU16788.1 PBSX family phage terminase large subunit [Clostridium botulinum]NFU19388.1 PBSX family phage terminase large subunit [Clostridium botulinum]
MKKKTKVVFKFKPFSKKQRKVLNWWTESSPVKDADGIIADGAIRSGKTVSMALSFVIWATENFNGQNLGMCGKTVGSFKRNVWFWLKLMLWSRGYKVTKYSEIGDNVFIISKNNKSNYYYIFGGKDEGSQDLIQGITLAGAFFDEAALMPESFVNQATGRCSVDGSKFWFNCNPDGPMHWFKVNWIDKSVGYLSKEQQNDLISKGVELKNILYLHFTMDDNLSLSKKIKARYRSMYVGVFFKRYILGLWSMAEGAIFDMWSEENEITEEQLPLGLEHKARRYISIDYGTTNPMVFLDIYDDGDIVWITKEYYYDSKVKMIQKTDKQYGDDLEEFIKHGPQPVAIILDPSAASFKSEMRNRGYRIKPADNEVSDGIRMTSTLIGQRKIKMVKSNCKRSLSDILSYVWDKKASQRGEEKPIKENDHGADALRYFVKTIIRPRRLAR